MRDDDDTTRMWVVLTLLGVGLVVAYEGTAVLLTGRLSWYMRGFLAWIGL